MYIDSDETPLALHGSGGKHTRPAQAPAQPLTINYRVPALLWGPDDATAPLYVAVHGDKSNKADDAIAAFATLAAARGYRVLSFDLPGHGTRADGDTCPDTVQNAVRDTATVLAYAQTIARDISLFAVSAGAFYSLLACQNIPVSRALFLSPLVDMRQTIESMMGWFGVDEAQLQAEGAVPTPIGKTLYWDTYQYVQQNPVKKWAPSTAILYGDRDEVVSIDSVKAFAGAFGAELTVLEGFEHYFHTAEHLATLTRWAGRYL